MSRAQRRAHLQTSRPPLPLVGEGQGGGDLRTAIVVAPPTPNPSPPGGGGGIPEVSDLDCAFQGRWRVLLPPWDQLTKDEQRGCTPFCEGLQSIFFNGGKLSDHGITPRSGYDLTKIMRYLRATLPDFGPSHERKIGGIGHMLAKWCHHDGRKSR